MVDALQRRLQRTDELKNNFSETSRLDGMTRMIKQVKEELIGHNGELEDAIFEEFRKEAIVLDDLVDFFEVVLTGREDVSVHFESEHELLAHLAELDRMCFDSLELAKRLGVDKAVVHFFTRGEIAFDEKIAILDRLHKKAIEDGISLCLENTGESVNELKKVFAGMPRLRFCLDVGHANLFSNNPLDFIEAFSDRLAHIHISDNRGGDSEEDDLHLPPGDGAIDFQRIFSELKAIDYDKTLTLELYPFSDINVKVEGLRFLRKNWDSAEPPL